MTNKPLFKAIINLAVFLSICPDEVVDPTEAVNQLEQLTASLSDLDESVAREFVEYCREYSDYERVNGASVERVNAILELPQCLGLDIEE